MKGTLGLVLSGGFLRGAFQVGVIEALHARGLHVRAGRPRRPDFTDYALRTATLGLSARVGFDSVHGWRASSAEPCAPCPTCDPTGVTRCP